MAIEIEIHKPPAFQEFLATPFSVLAKVFAWLASVILPSPILVMDTNGYVVLKGIEDIDELDEDVLKQLADIGLPVRLESEIDDDESD